MGYANILCGIYGLKNTVDGKWYVGQSTNILARQSLHFYLLKKHRHSNAHLQRAYDKYGVSSFEFRIIELVSVELLDNRERAWITFHQATNREFGYNLESGGNLYKTHSEETRKKMSEARKGRKIGPFSKEHRRRLSESHKGYKPSKETLARMSKTKMGHKVSEETRRKLRIKSGARRHSATAIAKMSQIRLEFWKRKKEGI